MNPADADPAGPPPAAAETLPPGLTRRMTLRGEHHETHGSHYFSACDHFALWLGHDIADGIVTRRQFV